MMHQPLFVRPLALSVLAQRRTQTLRSISRSARRALIAAGVCAASLFGPLSGIASAASAGCTATASGLAFTYVANFQQIVVAQPFSAGEQIQITYTTYTNGGGVAIKTVNVGQGNGSGNANAGGFGSFTLSAPDTFGPFTVPGGGITQLSMSIAGGQGTMNSTGTITCLLAAPAATPATPTTQPPVFGAIANQTVAQNSSMSVPFIVNGSVIASALRFTITSSNSALLPVSPSTLNVTCQPNGSCVLLIAPADGRGGISTVTLSAADGSSTASSSFAVTVPVVRPSRPEVALANVSGSGVSLTWSLPDSGAPVAYAVAWGTTSGASTLPLQLVPGTAGRLDFSSLPNGTYYFRVYAIGAGDISPASPQTSATVTSSATAPGPPNTLRLTGGINATWSAPSIGTAPTVYEVQIGSSLGASDIGAATTGSTSFGTTVGSGSYWVRVRGASGGSVGAWSSSVQIPVGSSGPCVAAPPTPTLLPPTTAGGGQAAFVWWSAGGSPADYYQLQVAPGAGLAAVSALNTNGPATGIVWPQAGSYAARVVAVNACGTSGRSNEVSFTTQQ
jgi:hypothetical protein